MTAMVANLFVALVLSVSTHAALVDINNRVIVTYTNSSKTFTNIPGLSFPLTPNTIYQFQVSIVYKGNYPEFAVAPMPTGTTFTICGNQFYASNVRAGCTSESGYAISAYQGAYYDSPAV